jgi:pyruvate/2-oxoglutarate dehydrogenase complex dihydrolipoamide acyltransferase (E2) component
MATVINMPRLGLNEDETENVLGEWFVSEGDAVKKGDELFSIETDKSSMVVYAEEAGTVLKTFYEAYDLVPVMAPMCVIGEAGEDIDGLIKAAETEQPKETLEDIKEATAATEATAQKEILPSDNVVDKGFSGAVSPRAKKLAQANGIDCSKIHPSGAEGRVIEADVIEATKNGFAVAEGKVQETSYNKVVENIVSEEPTRIPLTPIRKAIANNMYNSLHTMAQTSDSVEVDVTELVQLKAKLAAKKEELGVKITINDLLSYAAVKVAEKHPLANARFAEKEIITYPYVNLSMAVATDYGLTSPVVHHADKMSLIELSRALHDVTVRARERKLTPNDQKDGTFTLTNMGIFPVDNFNPILPSPQSCILGFGRCVEKPSVYNGQICIRTMMVLSVTYDHRVFDGGEVGSIMKNMKEYLETPELFLVQ